MLKKKSKSPVKGYFPPGAAYLKNFVISKLFKIKQVAISLSNQGVNKISIPSVCMEVQWARKVYAAAAEK